MLDGDDESVFSQNFWKHWLYHYSILMIWCLNNAQLHTSKVYVTGFAKPIPNHTKTEFKYVAEHLSYVYTCMLPRNTKHIAINYQVCFHRWFYAGPIKLQKCTTGSVELVEGINKDVSSARLLPMTVSTYLWIKSVSITYWRHRTIVCDLTEGIALLPLPRVHNFIGGGEYPILYTAAKHTALSYDAICCWHLRW